MTATIRPEIHQSAVTNTLNHHIACALDLYSQVKQAHWTVTGPNFIAIHELFDDQAALLVIHVDLFAERMRALRAIPSGTIRQAGHESPLPDLEARELPWRDAIGAILIRFETYSGSLSKAIEDAEKHRDFVTQDIYIEAAREVEKQAYLLRSHLAQT